MSDTPICADCPHPRKRHLLMARAGAYRRGCLVTGCRCRRFRGPASTASIVGAEVRESLNALEGAPLEAVAARAGIGMETLVESMRRLALREPVDGDLYEVVEA